MLSHPSGQCVWFFFFFAVVAALSGSRLLSIVGWIYSWYPQLFDTAMPGVSEPPHYVGRSWHMALFSVDTRTGSCRWGGEDGYWFLTKHPRGSLFHQSQLMFRGPTAWEPAWCYSFITTQAHTCTTCSCVVKSNEEGDKPSEPMMKWWMSGPVDMRGPTQLFSITPRGVTIFMWTT